MEHVCIGGQGTGLADLLFKYVLETASLKVDRVELYVAVDNPRGTKFYRKFGFESYGVDAACPPSSGRGFWRADVGEKVPATGGSMAAGKIVTRYYASDGGLGDRIDERLRSLGFEEPI